MASEFDNSDFVDRDFVASHKSAPTNPPPPASSAGGRPPNREELEAKLGETQQRLADLKRAQEALEQQRAQVEEARRRRVELQQGREEMVRSLTRGLGILEQAEFNSRRDAEQMTKTLTDFRDALAKVQSIQEETWTQENWEVELTRALTSIDNARMEWNGARLKWPILDGEAPSSAPGSARQPSLLESAASSNQSFGQLCRIGFALTWPVAAVALLAVIIFAIALFRK